MSFVDVAKVVVVAGKGGNGAVSFRHEKYIEYGGPDGGDGGKGGDVVFRANKQINTLEEFRYKPRLVAEDGGAGAKRNKHGKAGQDLVVEVPVGTIVRKAMSSDINLSKTASRRISLEHASDSTRAAGVLKKSISGDVVADLSVDGQLIVVAHGGDGGFGNAHFKSSTRQAPRVAENGEKGESFEAELELKLLADVGLVGFPSSGKSTFLSVVTSAKPEIADYPFTTLTPNLGVADIDGESLLIADIPGLIEGASEGKGLGHEFLRHIERNYVILHLIDVLNDDVAEAYLKIRAELEKYSPELAKTPEVVALTKTDVVDDEIVAMQSTELSKVTKSPVFAISSSAHKGLKEVLRAVLVEKNEESKKLVKEVKQEGGGLPTISLGQKDLDKSWEVISLSPDDLTEVASSQTSLEQDEPVDTSEEPSKTSFKVVGTKIEKFARKTDPENVHSLNRLRDIMRKMGIVHELERRGAKGDSVIKIDDLEFTLIEQ